MRTRILVVSLLLAAFGPRPGTDRPADAAPGVAGLVAASVVPLPPPGPGDDQGGLRLGVRDGVPAAPPRERLPEAVAAPLDADEADTLLLRLPSLTPTAVEEDEFAFPEETLPPPRTGETIAAPFPPRDQGPPPDVAPSGPLTVVRRAPEGDVPLAPHLSVTFSRPMVPVTSHGAAAAVDVPVRLAPRTEGAWRWIGTRTALFEPQGRFPMATEYDVTVRAGARATTGETLGDAVRWSFRTPPPQVRHAWPTGGPHPLDPVLFVSFDQRVAPEAALRSIELRAGRKSRSLRLATAEEVSSQPEVRRLADQAGEGRWVAFRATKRLPSDREIVVSVGPGTPSAEGPLRSKEAYTFTFRTYAALAVEDTRCGWGEQCPPFAAWLIRFNNPIDEAAFDPSLVRVEPALPDQRIEVSGRRLVVRGLTKGRTVYEVRLDGRLRDAFGQKLGEAETVRFAVGDAPSALDLPGAPFVTLDPAGAPTLSVYSVNHERLLVELYAVTPTDWPAFVRYMQRHPDDERAPNPPGRRVSAETIETGGAPDTLTETRVDLSRALEDGHGHVVAVIAPPQDLLKKLWGGGARRRDVRRAWVQATRIGLTATVDAGEMIAWATDLLSGAPLGDVDVRTTPGDAATRTGPDGIARLPLWDRNPDPDVPALVVAHKGLDVALLPQRIHFRGRSRGWATRDPGVALRWFVFDDRKLYRPGEELRVKGFVRRLDMRERGDLQAVGPAVREIAWRLEDSRGNEVGAGTATLTPLGGFDLAAPLPEAMNLGGARLRLEARPAEGVSDAVYSHPVEVREFRRPEYEVTAAPDEGPHLVGGHAVVTARARYFAGGGLANADVTWRVTTRPGHFAPPGRGDYVFGVWTPWWKRARTGDDGGATVTHASRTDAAGEHHLRLDLEGVDPPRPTAVEASATVMDVNRQAWTATANLLVHPSTAYVGLRTERTFVERGAPIEVAVIVADLDGEPLAGRPVVVEAVRREWVRRKGRWIERDAEPERCEVTSAVEPAACTFATKRSGRYRIRAATSDAAGRPNRSELTVWVAGDERPPERSLAHEAVELIPDRPTYAPGDVAEVLVQAPFHPAEGLLTVRRSGVVAVERFRVEGPSHVLRVPIEGDHVPNVTVAVELVGAAPRTASSGKVRKDAPPRPAFAGGTVRLRVPPLRRTLALTASPRAARLEPGGETTIDLVLRDAGGRPVAGGEVAVVVVDEAVLALTGYRIADPIDVFYPPRPAGAEDFHLRRSVLLADLADPAAALEDALERSRPRERMLKAALPPKPAAMADMAAGGAAPGGGGETAAPIALREDFRALALFAPVVTTDREGRATVPLTLPDNLTRYRVMAVAAADARQFGSAESVITARLPLMVRPSAPRFLNFGDHAELPVVLHNQTDGPLPVSVAVRAAGVTVPAPHGWRVTVPPDDRVEVRFALAATQAGDARFQVAAAAGPFADAATFALPVWTPATAEAFATYGTLDEDAAVVQPVAAPSDAIAAFGGLAVTTSSTALQTLTDAVLYLVGYPFECSEQIASRVLAIAALRDVLDAFDAEGLPPPDELQAAVARDIERLRTLQNVDGGFGFWRRGDRSWPWLGVHAAHALARASQKGFAVPAELLAQSQRYLRTIDEHIPARYGDRARLTIRAYALYVRRHLRDADAAAAQQIVREVGADALPLEAAGFLLPLLASSPKMTPDLEAVLQSIDNRVEETAGAAHFVTRYEDDDWLLLHSDRRADGILLEALVEVRPVNELVGKLVTGLLAHRQRGRWTNTQENAFALLALDRYFAEFERQPPSFVARLWLGGRLAATHSFEGRTTERRSVSVPMRVLAEAGPAGDLVVAKEGTGRMYYRIAMRYAPEELALAAADHGFTVERSYEPVDDPADVRRDDDGTWRVAAGARVRVRVRMVAPTRRHHVALVDPLPAGFEPLDPALAVTGPLPEDPTAADGGGPWWWWARTWYEHQNLRDERAEAFASLVWPGVHTYTYLARATTPGRFVVPPPRAEEMYAPETFGRGASGRVVVE